MTPPSEPWSWLNADPTFPQHKKLLTAIREMKSALEFYANQDSWEWNGIVIDDGGKRLGYGLKARETLARLEKGDFDGV